MEFPPDSNNRRVTTVAARFERFNNHVQNDSWLFSILREIPDSSGIAATFRNIHSDRACDLSKHQHGPRYQLISVAARTESCLKRWASIAASANSFTAASSTRQW